MYIPEHSLTHIHIRVYTFLPCGSISSFLRHTRVYIHVHTVLPACIYVYTPAYLAAQYRHSFRRTRMYICTQSYPHVYRCIRLVPFGSICHFLRRTHMYIPIHSLTHMYIGVYGSYLAARYRHIPRRTAETLIAFLENLMYVPRVCVYSYICM